MRQQDAYDKRGGASAVQTTCNISVAGC